MMIRDRRAQSARIAASVLALCATTLGPVAHAAPQAADAMSVAGAAPPDQSKPPKIIPICVPIGLATHKGLLYVGNHWTKTGCGGPGQILVYSGKGVQIPSRTITADIGNPAGLAFDAAGNLYVADSDKDQVTVYDPTGKELKNKTLQTDKSYNASGVQIDGEGNVWVASRTNSNIGIGEIQIFHKGGQIQTITQGLVYPLGIAFIPGTGNAWVANSETPNDAISTYDSGGNFLKSYPTPNFTPTYLVFRGRSAIVTDGLHSQVQVFKSNGKPSGNPITNGLAFPYGVALGPQSTFYVANVGAGGTNNGSSIGKYTLSGTLVCSITTSSCK
jgi:hypothetical protein